MLFLTKFEFLFFSTVYGLIFGSFINVLIHRIPKIIFQEYNLISIEYLKSQLTTRMLKNIEPPNVKKKLRRLINPINNLQKYNIFYPRSHCPICKTNIIFFDNIPIISYLILRGKCRACSSPIGFSYMAVEIISTIGSIGLAFLIMLEHELANTQLLLELIFFNLLLSFSIALFIIDCRFKLLPDALTIPLGFLGIFFCTFKSSHIEINESIFGGLIGFLILWILFWLYKFYSGREGLGRGDIKLTSALGAWVGISNIMDVLLVASVLGLLVSGLMIFLNKHTYNKTIAFGPFLILGGHFVIIKEFLL